LDKKIEENQVASKMLSGSRNICGMPSGRKESAQRHINNPRAYGGQGLPSQALQRVSLLNLRTVSLVNDPTLHIGEKGTKTLL
jgi:hypothetical protein